MSAGPYDHSTYLSPFTWRYGSPEMRTIWSEEHKRRTWRRIWVALAGAQCDAGLVTDAQVDDLRAHASEIDLDTAHAIEAEIKHDLMAEVKTFAAQCSEGAGIIHLGATSMDIEDNADALRMGEALDLLLSRLGALIDTVCGQCETWANRPTMAFTHLQPAEPTTIGYRMAQTLWDLSIDLGDLQSIRASIMGKGFKGATGSSASYEQLLAGGPLRARDLEATIMDEIGLTPMPVATQTYARKQDFRLLSALASLGQSLYKFAADLRLLQSPPLGEWAEPFGSKQVGSSAMPFKRNPINAENINSLTRLLAALPRVAWDNAAHSYLERTLDDSANRRSVLAEAFLIADESVKRAQRIIGGLRVDERASDRLLDVYGTFAATERVLMELVKRGGSRQDLHELIREHSLAAWAALRDGKPNPLVQSMSTDPHVLSMATADEVIVWLDASDYTGDAGERTLDLVATVRAQRGAAA
ncbi:MAG: adenylosuccinate lyase [Myxococcales bacterium]|nr:adenylosuccinate lyase [Myxococcales bacterium]